MRCKRINESSCHDKPVYMYVSVINYYQFHQEFVHNSYSQSPSMNYIGDWHVSWRVLQENYSILFEYGWTRMSRESAARPMITLM